jgi:hypothetical protein
MKTTLAFLFAALVSAATSQVALNATVFLSDEAGNPAGGVPVSFSVQAAGAVYAANANTNEAGEAVVSIELPNGTMQGMLNATYMNCDSVDVMMNGSFSANALGGLSDVYLTGIYCGGGSGGEGCEMELEGGLTVVGSWMFMVSGAPEDAVYDWSIDGATMSNSNAAEFGWQFDGESVWTVCVYVTSGSCEPWTDCQSGHEEAHCPWAWQSVHHWKTRMQSTTICWGNCVVASGYPGQFPPTAMFMMKKNGALNG